MSILIQQPLARVTLRLFASGNKPLITATVESSLPALDSEANLRALEAAMAATGTDEQGGNEASRETFVYPDCENVAYELQIEGGNMEAAAAEAMKQFHERAKALHAAVLARVQARIDQQEAQYRAQAHESMRKKYTRKRFGFFGAEIVPQIPQGQNHA